MSNDALKNLGDVALAVLFPTGFIAKKGIEALTNTEAKAMEGKTLRELEEEAGRTRIAIEKIKAQARAEQEIAIAQRILTASEVEIEDYYDASGKGGLGLDVSEGLSLGAHGAGQKVTRRIIRLKGWPDAPLGAVEIVRKDNA